MAWKWRWVIIKIVRSFMAMSVLGIGADVTEDMVSSEESWVLQSAGVERDIPGRGAYSSRKELSFTEKTFFPPGDLQLESLKHWYKFETSRLYMIIWP